MPQSQSEYRRILNAALARNADTACRLLEEHIRKGIRVVRQGMRNAAVKSKTMFKKKKPNTRKEQ